MTSVGRSTTRRERSVIARNAPRTKRVRLVIPSVVDHGLLVRCSIAEDKLTPELRELAIRQGAIPA